MPKVRCEDVGELEMKQSGGYRRRPRMETRWERLFQHVIECLLAEDVTILLRSPQQVVDVLDLQDSLGTHLPGRALWTGHDSVEPDRCPNSRRLRISPGCEWID